MRLLILHLLPLFVSAVKINLTGVDPIKHHLYQEKKLKCPGENGKALTPDMINDDFCDCPEDGFDEPGTAACSTGRFWCENSGWKGKSIPSFMVNDGVCDCCDGSDEYLGRIKCPNTCESIRLKHEEEDARKQKQLSDGLIEREKMVFKAKEILTKQQLELTQLKFKVTMYENQLQTLESLSDLEIPTAPVSASSSQDKEIVDISNGFEEMCLDLQKKFLKIQTIFNKLKESPGLCSECAAAVKEFEEMEQESKFSGFATEDSASEGVLSSELYKQLSLDGEPLNGNDLGEGEEEKSIWASLKKFGMAEVRSFFSKYTTTTTVTVTSQPSPTGKGFGEAKNDPKEEAEMKLMRAKRAYSEAESKTNLDYGPDNVFLALKDQCIEMIDKKYKYELCWFDKVKQVDTSNGYDSSVSLGIWDNWTSDSDYKSMHFKNGQMCWNGPARSTTVHLECGATNEIVEVEEPSTCQYVMKVRTPAACQSPQEPDELAEKDL